MKMRLYLERPANDASVTVSHLVASEQQNVN